MNKCVKCGKETLLFSLTTSTPKGTSSQCFCRECFRVLNGKEPKEGGE